MTQQHLPGMRVEQAGGAAPAVSQNDRILRHLRTGRGLTALQALNLFGCLRLAARINDLRRQGHQISSETVTREDGKRYAMYWLD